MNGIYILIFAAAVAAVWITKKAGQISSRKAAALLRNGALVIDVRTPAEYHSDHLARAINIPLDRVETAVPERVPGKDQVLLLHCLAGGRSAMAQRKLRSIGYLNAYNLGSYRRAASLLRRSQTAA